MWGDSPGQPVAQSAGQLRAGLSQRLPCAGLGGKRWERPCGSKDRERRAGGWGSPKKGHRFFKESPEMWVCQPERREQKQPPAEMGTVSPQRACTEEMRSRHAAPGEGAWEVQPGWGFGRLIGSCLQPSFSAHSFAAYAEGRGWEAAVNALCSLHPPLRPPVAAPLKAEACPGLCPPFPRVLSCIQAPRELEAPDSAVPRIPLSQREAGIEGQHPPFSPVSNTLPCSLREDPEVTFQTHCLHPNPRPRVCPPREGSHEWAGPRLQKSLPSHRH